MTKKYLWRDVDDGKILRIPTGHNPAYPNAGALWRGPEICCQWEITDYYANCPLVCDQYGSILTPKYLTVELTGLTDCPACDVDASDLNGVKILLTRTPLALYNWTGSALGWSVGVSQRIWPIESWSFVWRDSPSQQTPWGVGEGDLGGDVRLGVIWDTNYWPEGWCCSDPWGWEVVAYGGQMQLWPGDAT